MKRAWLIARNDLRLHLRTRVGFIWMFAVPVVFIYFMGFAARGPDGPSNPRPAVLVENLDTNFLGRLFVEELEAQGLRRVDPTNRDSATRGVRIPADLTQRALNGQSTELAFFKQDGPDDPASALIQLRYYRALLALNGIIVESALRHDGKAELTEASLRELQKAPAPIEFHVSFAGRKPMPSGFNFSLPGNLVMYTLMNLLIFGGASVAWERRTGMLRRIQTLPVTRPQLLLGKLGGLMLLGVVQIAFLILAGTLLFGVRLGANLPAVFITLLIYAWVAGSLGILLGSILTAEDRIVGLAVLSSILMAALGGCWWPLELAPPFMQHLALALPSGWAMKALHILISFGGNLRDVLPELAVLAAFGTAANLLAIRFFRV